MCAFLDSLFQERRLRACMLETAKAVLVVIKSDKSDSFSRPVHETKDGAALYYSVTVDPQDLGTVYDTLVLKDVDNPLVINRNVRQVTRIILRFNSVSMLSDIIMMTMMIMQHGYETVKNHHQRCWSM